MSVASINNGTLQLSDLIISNEKYSNSAGYAPSTSSFTAGLTGTNLAVGSLTLLGGNQPYPTITATSGAVNNVSIGGDINIGGNLVINPNVVSNPGVPAVLYNGITSPSYGGGMTAFATFYDISITSPNSQSSYNITNFPYNPFPGYDIANVICIPTIYSQYGAVCDQPNSPNGAVLTNNGDGTINIQVSFYSVNAQVAWGVTGLLFYNKP
jgi:hypothetical protein